MFWLGLNNCTKVGKAFFLGDVLMKLINQERIAPIAYNLVKKFNSSKEKQSNVCGYKNGKYITPL